MTPPINEQVKRVLDAHDWCRDYVSKHQENFEIASRLFLPYDLREVYYALYTFARGADDAADSSSTEAASIALDEWQAELDAVYSDDSDPTQQTFIALRDALQHHFIERELFQRMIDAFRQDQIVHRYQSWQDLRRYTKGSADPVGRWVLRAHSYNVPALDRWSDAICTGLQLVNFMQDVREDYETLDRIYLPQEDLIRFGVSEAMFVQSPTPEPLRELLRFEAERAECLFSYGRPLLFNVHPKLKRQLILFHGGGRLALHALRRANYDVTGKHISASKLSRLALLVRALRGKPL